VFVKARVDAALAASVFHSAQIVVRKLKQTVIAAGVEIRP
jgi:imidazole glycerol phosphate synthase subunit HisF